MTSMGPPPPDGEYVPPKTDDPYGLKYLADHPLGEERKAELAARLAELRDQHTEGTPP